MSFSVSQLKYILVLGNLAEAGNVRISDIAKTLNIKRSSAFNMLNKLAEADVIVKNENKTVEFTKKGRDIAEKLNERVKEASDKLTDCFDLTPDKAEEYALLLISVTGDIA